MHNKTLNQHRANALKTFLAFVEGTQDDRIKDAVLLQACQAAFKNRATGYEKNEPDHDPLKSVIEVFGKGASKAE